VRLLPARDVRTLANKLTRRLWAMEHHHVAFDANHLSVRA
jgi:hypothetical protein